MNADGKRGGPGRSIGAVAAGFVSTATLSIGMDVLMHAINVYPPLGQPMSDGLYVWATVYRMAFTVVGGYVTARLAPRNPRRHVLALCVLGLAAAAAGTIVTWNRGAEFGPLWYSIALIVSAPAALVGSALAERASNKAAVS